MHWKFHIFSGISDYLQTFSDFFLQMLSQTLIHYIEYYIYAD